MTLAFRAYRNNVYPHREHTVEKTSYSGEIPHDGSHRSDDGVAGHQPMIRAALIGRRALRNRGKGMTRTAAKPVSVKTDDHHHHVDLRDSHGEPSSPSGRLFHRISMSLKDRQCEHDNGVHYCDIVDSSCYNRPCSCEEDLECWRHGNFRMSPPNPSYMSHAASGAGDAKAPGSRG